MEQWTSPEQFLISYRRSSETMDVAGAIIDFLQRNGFAEAEAALRVDLDSFDRDRFLFPIDPALSPLKIPSRFDGDPVIDSAGEFFTVGDSSSDFTNPYGQRDRPESSPDGLSVFYTARDYREFDFPTPRRGGDVVDDKHVTSGAVEILLDPVGESDGKRIASVDSDSTDELLSFCRNFVREYQVFDLRVVHRKNRQVINSIHRFNRFSSTPNRTGFEEQRDFPVRLNAVTAGRYYVEENLGSAAFSCAVLRAKDIQTGIDVCLKIIKNNKDFFDQSLDEIKLLKLANKHDPTDERHILRLYDYYYHREHLFIVSELLRENLYQARKLEETYFTRIRLRAIARQCLEALEYLHGIGIIHCDLKPENILIRDYDRCEIKIIDLGNSCFKEDRLCPYVQSRSYRAPEVILGFLPYDETIDVWSLGCILAELYSGQVLFPNEGRAVMLARMAGMLGPFDEEMLASGNNTGEYFTADRLHLYQINEKNEAEYIIPVESPLEEILLGADPPFIDFLKQLLQLNPCTRPSAAAALHHPWILRS